jgi:uncharacterized protein
MTQPAKAVAQEPTMEEILASIRRIIADDDTGKAPPRAAEPVPPAAARPDPVPPPPVASVTPLPPVAEPVAQQAQFEPPALELEEEPLPDELPASDVLELTESMAAPEPPPTGGFQTIDGESDLVFEDRPIEPEPAPAIASRAEPVEDPLISANTTAAVDSAFNTLAHTVLVQNARTLEDLVREMLRPLLKTWLDDNLPRLVERLVRAEIERVSRGRN